MNKSVDAAARAASSSAPAIMTLRDLQRISTRQIESSIGAGREVFVAVVAIDGFADVERRYGPATVDRILRAVTGAVAAELRPQDALGAYGRGTFIAILSYCDLDTAERVCESIRSAVATTRINVAEMSVSIGVAGVADGEPDAARAIRRAETALQIAQERGPNRVVIDDLVFA